MAHIYYFAADPDYWTNATLSNGHYLRLGTYESQWEPGSANISDGSHSQGVYLTTCGKYSLKTTSDAYIEVEKGISRTIESGDYDYTNETGNYDIDVQDGEVHIESEKEINITSSHDGTASTSITIQADGHELYYQQAGYAKYVDEFKKTTVTGFTHKTNIGIVIKIYGGAGLQNYSGFGLSYKSVTLGVKVAEASTSGVSLAIYGTKNSLVFISKWGLTLVPSQIVWLHEEYCVFKNEFKFHRFETKFNEAEVELAEHLSATVGADEEVASMETEIVYAHG